MSKKVTTEERDTTALYPKLIETRLSQLKFALEEQKAEMIALTYLPNIRYFTNFSGSAAAVFLTEDQIYFVTDDRYEEQIKDELYPLQGLSTHISRDPWQYCLDKGIFNNIDSMLFEADKIAYSDAVNIRNQIRPIKFKPVTLLAEPFTIPKAPEELENIQAACNTAVKVYEKMLPMIKAGVSELDIAIEISYQARKLGSENDPFDIIVTSGPRGALVHGMPSDKKLKYGEVVIMDFGCRINGFVSDITRSVVVGRATKEQKALYKMLYDAKEAAVNGVRPGMNGKHLDKLARSIIEKAGYGPFFQHSLGHGIGLVPHEMPLITFRKDDQIVPEHCVLAIEPGIYLSGKFGMRIEDNIYITRHGTTALTSAPEELVVVG